MNIIANKDKDMHFLLDEIESKESEIKEIKNEYIHLARKTGRYKSLSGELSDKEIDTIFKNAKVKKICQNNKPTSGKKSPDLGTIEEMPSEEVTVTGKHATPSVSVDKKSAAFSPGGKFFSC